MRFSTDSRSGPGRISSVACCACSVSKMSVSACRSFVGSPFTSMNCAVCVIGSKTMMNFSGSCSEMIAFSPAGSSSDSSVIVSQSARNPPAARAPS